MMEGRIRIKPGMAWHVTEYTEAGARVVTDTGGNALIAFPELARLAELSIPREMSKGRGEGAIYWQYVGPDIE